MTEPSVTVRAYHYSIGSNLPVNRVVIHDEEYPVSVHSAEDVAQYFTEPTSGGSAHYVVDADSEVHCLPDTVIAWHAPPNRGSIGIEMDGYARFAPADWQTPGSQGSIRMAAKRTAELCHRFNLPVQWLSVQDLLAGKRGITSHANVSAAWKQSDHTDPGTNFPVGQFIQLVNEAYGPSPTPTPTKVDPMFNPPQVLEPIVASRKAPNGGVWLLAASGAIYSYEGAPYAGSPRGKAYFVGKSAATFADLSPDDVATGKVYVVLSTDGRRYAYPE